MVSTLTYVNLVITIRTPEDVWKVPKLLESGKKGDLMEFRCAPKLLRSLRYHDFPKDSSKQPHERANGETKKPQKVRYSPIYALRHTFDKRRKAMRWCWCGVNKSKLTPLYMHMPRTNGIFSARNISLQVLVHFLRTYVFFYNSFQSARFWKY